MSKTINQALADLVTGLGESSSVLADNSTISDYIGDLEDAIKKCAAAEAGDVLPAVTAEDDGSLLGVSSGKWAKVAAPAPAAGITVLPLSWSSPNYTIQTDKTFEELVTSINAGDQYVFAAYGTGEVVYYYVSSAMIIDMMGQKDIFLNLTHVKVGATQSGVVFNVKYLNFENSKTTASASKNISFDT